ncbi:MAG: protoporphyrinogen oxidase, partial [Mariprofundaceae bacterium]|nr:protoporphyrinogen oxidase [Mariprofundaceae bacterium]
MVEDFDLKQAGKSIVVIGGGISGLTTAFWLRQQGYEVTVLERDARAGGVIRSERIKGYTIDHAANCLMNFLPEVNHLIETVGLAGEQVFRDPGANKRYLLKQGVPQAVPLTPKEIFTSSFWPWPAKLRMAMEPFIPASGPDTGETVAEFIRRRFGRELLEQAIDPFVAGTLSGDPDRTCVQSAMPKFYGLEQKYGSVIRGAIASKLAGVRTRCPGQMSSFRTGMEALPAAIARYLGDRVLTGARVSLIERIGRQWVVTAVYAGSTMQIEADAVVVAAPAQAAAQLLEPLSDLVADQLKGIVYAPMGVLTLGFRARDIAHSLDGIGCLVP